MIRKIAERINYILDALPTEYTRQAFTPHSGVVHDAIFSHLVLGHIWEILSPQTKPWEITHINKQTTYGND